MIEREHPLYGGAVGGMPTAQAKAALGEAQLKLARAMYRLKVLEHVPSSHAEREEASHTYRAAMEELRGAWARWQAVRASSDAFRADALLAQALGTRTVAAGCTARAGTAEEARGASDDTGDDTGDNAGDDAGGNAATLPRLEFARWLVKRGRLNEWPKP